MFSIAAVALPDEAYSGDRSKRPRIRTIEKRYHHLGDEDLPYFVVQEVEGTYWETHFRLRKYYFRNKEIAFVKFLAHNLDFADLIVNGNLIKLQQAKEPTIQNFWVYIVPIPFDFLLLGKNTIGIQCNQWADGNWDDLEFGELEIWLQ